MENVYGSSRCLFGFVSRIVSPSWLQWDALGVSPIRCFMLESVTESPASAFRFQSSNLTEVLFKSDPAKRVSTLQEQLRRVFSKECKCLRTAAPSISRADANANRADSFRADVTSSSPLADPCQGVAPRSACVSTGQCAWDDNYAYCHYANNPCLAGGSPDLCGRITDLSTGASLCLWRTACVERQGCSGDTCPPAISPCDDGVYYGEKRADN